MRPVLTVLPGGRRALGNAAPAPPRSPGQDRWREAPWITDIGPRVRLMPEEELIEVVQSLAARRPVRTVVSWTT